MENNNNENPQNSGDNVERNADGTFKKGHTKLGGIALGTNHFETDFDEAVCELAKEEGITRSEARKTLLKVAYKNAKDGNYSFYKDIHDRIYGQATTKTEHSGSVGITNDFTEEEKEKLLNILK